MLRRLFFSICALAFTVSLSFLHGQDPQQLLKSEDVRKVMDQVFSQHVDKKSISATIIRNSFRVYIDQFDPEKVYLLDSEIQPFLSIDDNQIQQIILQYKNNDFSAYYRLNSVIQKSIIRAEEYRKTLETSDMEFINSNRAAIKNDEGEPRYPQYAGSLDELQARQKNLLQRFSDAEVRRYGIGLVKKKEAELLSFYDKFLRNQESRYLFVNSEGALLPTEEKQNLFIMHVIKSLASSLDAHTSFFDQSEAYDLRVRLEKSFDGVGITLKQELDGVSIATMLPNSPAANSGLMKIDDYLVAVNGKDVSTQTADDVMKLLRGDNGTTVSLVIKRTIVDGNKPSAKLIHVDLQRAPIVVNEGRAQATYESFGNGIIGTIKLDSFYQGDNGITSEQDVRDAIRQLQQKGNLRGLILDLRSNSGGFLTQAVKVAGLFITNGVVVVSKYSNGDEHFYRDMDGKIAYDGPLIVLTSRGTASAAEIVAQALQDYGVALVVGDAHTYGKGTIQSQTVTNEEGGNAYFKVTVGKYYTVSGKTPQIHGVKADVVVPGPYNSEPLGEEYLEYTVDNDDHIPPSFSDPLGDIDPSLRPWYLRYYMPTLQRQTMVWKESLPILQKNSSYRITHNKNYQHAIHQWKQENLDEVNASDNPYGKEDPQLHEAVNIAKDMIVLDTKFQDPHHALQETASLSKSAQNPNTL